MPFTKKNKGIIKPTEVKGTANSTEVKNKVGRGRPRKKPIPDDDGDEWQPTGSAGKTESKKRSSDRPTTIDYYDGRSSRPSSRRNSKVGVDLLMECIEEDLSPAQLKAIQQAKEEHEKANDLIKAARAGNILVPSSQPNTFTIVPPTAKQARPTEPEKIVKTVQSEVSKQLAQPPKAAISTGLPPPRPTQFMNKQKALQQQTATSSTPEVIVIGESPPPPTTPRMMIKSPVSSQTGMTSPAILTSPIQPKTQLLGTNATPQQVYKFVSLPGNQPTNNPNSQWVIKPLLTVSPQQQAGLSPPITGPRPVQLVNYVPSPALPLPSKTPGDVPPPRRDLTCAISPLPNTSYLSSDICQSDDSAQDACHCWRNCCSELLPYGNDCSYWRNCCKVIPRRTDLQALSVTYTFRKEMAISLYCVRQDILNMLKKHMKLQNQNRLVQGKVSKRCLWKRQNGHFQNRIGVIEAKNCDNSDDVLGDVDRGIHIPREGANEVHFVIKELKDAGTNNDCSICVVKGCDKIVDEIQKEDRTSKTVEKPKTDKVVEHLDDNVDEVGELQELEKLGGLLDDSLTTECLAAEIRELSNYTTDGIEVSPVKDGWFSQSDSGEESDGSVEISSSSISRKYGERCNVGHNKQVTYKQLNGLKSISWCVENDTSEKNCKLSRHEAKHTSEKHSFKSSCILPIDSHFSWIKCKQGKIKNKLYEDNLKGQNDLQNCDTIFSNFRKEVQAILSGFDLREQFSLPENHIVFPVITSQRPFTTGQGQMSWMLYNEEAVQSDSESSEMCEESPRHLEYLETNVEQPQSELSNKVEHKETKGAVTLQNAETCAYTQIKDNKECVTKCVTGKEELINIPQETSTDTIVDIEASVDHNTFDRKSMHPWYHELCSSDKAIIAELSATFGITKLTKLLHIPKTELLTWRRQVRKKPTVLNKPQSIALKISDTVGSKHNHHTTLLDSAETGKVCVGSDQTASEIMTETKKSETMKENTNPEASGEYYLKLIQGLQERNPGIHTLLSQLIHKHYRELNETAKNSVEITEANNTSVTETGNISGMNETNNTSFNETAIKTSEMTDVAKNTNEKNETAKDTSEIIDSTSTGVTDTESNTSQKTETYNTTVLEAANSLCEMTDTTNMSETIISASEMTETANNISEIVNTTITNISETAYSTSEMTDTLSKVISDTANSASEMTEKANSITEINDTTNTSVTETAKDTSKVNDTANSAHEKTDTTIISISETVNNTPEQSIETTNNTPEKSDNTKNTRVESDEGKEVGQQNLEVMRTDQTGTNRISASCWNESLNGEHLIPDASCRYSKCFSDLGNDDEQAATTGESGEDPQQWQSVRKSDKETVQFDSSRLVLEGIMSEEGIVEKKLQQIESSMGSGKRTSESESLVAFLKQSECDSDEESDRLVIDLQSDQDRACGPKTYYSDEKEDARNTCKDNSNKNVEENTELSPHSENTESSPHSDLIGETDNAKNQAMTNLDNDHSYAINCSYAEERPCSLPKSLNQVYVKQNGDRNVLSQKIKSTICPLTKRRKKESRGFTILNQLTEAEKEHFQSAWLEHALEVTSKKPPIQTMCLDNIGQEGTISTKVSKKNSKRNKQKFIPLGDVLQVAGDKATHNSSFNDGILNGSKLDTNNTENRLAAESNLEMTEIAEAEKLKNQSINGWEEFISKEIKRTSDIFDHVDLTSLEKKVNCTAFRERIGRLCCLVGIDPVHEHYEIPKLDLTSWMREFLQSRVWYTIERNLSEYLKIKLVNLGKLCGKKEVTDQYNLVRSTFNRWTKKYSDSRYSDKYPYSLEFSDEDVQQLVMHSFHKESENAKYVVKPPVKQMEALSPDLKSAEFGQETEPVKTTMASGELDFTLLQPSEIKQEPIDEEFERLHGSSAHLSQTARPQGGYGYNNEIDRNKSYLGPVPFLVNDFGVGDGRSDTQPCTTNSMGTQHIAEGSNTGNSNPRSLSETFVKSQDQSVADNGKFTVQLSETSEMILLSSPDERGNSNKSEQTKVHTAAVTDTEAKEETSLPQSCQRQETKPSSVANSKEEDSKDVGHEADTGIANSLSFHVSDKELEQQKALRNTLLALKSRKVASDQSTAKSSNEQKKKVYIIQGHTIQSTGRIETLIKGISNRVGSSYSPGILNSVKPGGASTDGDHSYVSPVKAQMSPKRASPLSPRKGFNQPIIMRSRVKRVLDVDTSSNESSSIDVSPKKPVINKGFVSLLNDGKNTSHSTVDKTNAEKDPQGDPSVNLSEKLKSLLKADIFNIVDTKETKSENSDTQEEDLIELLASAGRKTEKLSDKKVSSKETDPKASPGVNDNYSEGENGQKLQKRFFYSLSLKQKLGKLAQKYSVMGISRKYKVNARSISKWKIMYKDMDLRDLEFTEQEKEELRIVRSIKDSHRKVSTDEYQIYIDNPEPDDDEIEEIEDLDNKSVIPSNAAGTYKHQNEVLQEQKKDIEDRWKPPISKPEAAKMRQTNTTVSESVPRDAALDVSMVTRDKSPSQTVVLTPQRQAHVPLYIDLSDTTADDVRDNLRQKIKTEDFDKTQVKSKGVFLGSSQPTVRENSSTSAFRTSGKPTPPSSGLALEASAKVPEEHQAKGDSTPNLQSRKGTVYLCPVEGVFKFRLADEKGPSMQRRKSEETQETNVSKKPTQGAAKTPEPSQAFKWSVVQEARKSGFEKTAKWYNYPITDIMKWHDSFLNKKEEKQNMLEVVQHAMQHGVINAASKFSVSKSKVVEWLSMEEALKTRDDSPKTQIDSTDERIDIPDRQNMMETNLPQRVQHRGLTFDLITAKEGRILKPRFNSTDNSPKVVIPPQTKRSGVDQQKSRMGPNSTAYANSAVKDSPDAYQDGLAADIGTMPRFVKQPGAGIEIASTWKQVQNYLNPANKAERRYSQEFKNRIIRECIEKGQKSVSKEQRIPYNEISRWRLEAKKNNFGKKPDTFPSHSSLPSVDLPTAKPKSSDHIPKTSVPQKKGFGHSRRNSQDKPDSVPQEEPPKQRENESLKIKIKLAKRPEIIETSHSEMPSTEKKQTENKKPKKKVSKTDLPEKDHETNLKERNTVEGPSTVGDNETDFRNEVVNYCIQHGVLKTQKHFSVTRQSVIDLMKEYDELNKYSVQAFNKNLYLKTKLVSREKTSVEDGTQSEPVFVTNLQDYIVTTEYKQSVADYAVLHGITAATRKFKRKTSTVKSWISHYGKKDEVSAVTAASKTEVVEYAKQFGITAASEKYSKKTVTVKNWMGHQFKMERTKKKQETEEAEEKEQTDVKHDPLKLTISKDPMSQKLESVTPSPLWEQDFFIKPNSNSSPLKLTLSPRRKSPVIHVTTDEVNDIETEDEYDVGGGSEFEEVATWDLEMDIEGRNKEKLVASKEDVIIIEEKSDENIAKESNTVTESKSEKHEQNNGKKDNFIVIPPRKSPNVQNVKLGKELMETKGADNDKQKQAQQSVKDEDPEMVLVKDEADIDKEQVEQTSNKELDFTEVSADMETEIDEATENIEEDNEATTCEMAFQSDVEEIKENDEEEEEEIEKIPYENTIMFHLFNDNVDKFFNDSTDCNFRAKHSLVKENTNKLPENPKKTKKHRRYADVEIMENIEETCIFSPVRINRRNQEPPEEPNKVQNNLKQEEAIPEASFKTETETDDKDRVESLNDNDTNKNEVDDTDINEVDAIAEENVAEEGKHEDNDEKETDESHIKQKRSLFDYFGPQDDVTRKEESEAETKVTDDTNTAYKLDGTVTVANEKEIVAQEKEVKLKINSDTPRSLFDNLLKNIRMPIKETTEMTNSSDVPIEKKIAPVEKDDENQDSDAKKCPEMKSKERNLFDFLSPEPIPTPIFKTKANTNKIVSLSQSATPTDDVKSQDAPEKGTLKLKPMFKFPKLQLPVNFSSIAKLGMAKIKEDEKIKVEKNKNDEEKSSDVGMFQAEGTIGVEDTNAKDGVAKAGDGEGNTDKSVSQTSADSNLPEIGAQSTKETSDSVSVTSAKNSNSNLQFKGVVMETFEELRKRLAEERAKKREEMKTSEIEIEAKSEQTEEQDKAGVETDTEITDYEMYKDFAPQKIVLILDISKKHGIEFACTSFDLPPSVIVNWIIEKDRKHRKLGSTVTLEEKLLAVKKHIENEDDIEENSVSISTLKLWREEVKWLLDSKGVVSVLEKWRSIQSVTSLDETGKPLVTDNKRDSHNTNNDKHKISQSKVEDNDKDTENEVRIVLKNIVESAVSSVETVQQRGEVEDGEPSGEAKVPDVLAFVQDTLPRDFTVEQKAMIVLLMDKFGLKEVHRKLGINKGTLWTWKNQNKVVKQFLKEQMDGVRKKVHVTSNANVKPGKVHGSPKELPITSAHTSEPQDEETDKDCTVTDKEPAFQPSGYRYISPTKLPSSLKDTFKRPTKEYSLEQRVAIVKLVELYGVRTVHKQFRIPCGSIWNWQHSKNIVAEIKKGEGKQEEDSAISKAAKTLNFDEEMLSSDPFTIDLIMDRVLVAIETTDHLKFKAHQKADVVCMVNHFGMDYVLEKIPSIPRGTLWNWCHNKNLMSVVEKNMQLLQKYEELVGKKKSGFRAEEKVDKAMMTQRWLNSCQQSTSTAAKRKDLDQDTDIARDSKKRKGEVENPSSFDTDEISGHTDYTIRRSRMNSRKANYPPSSARDSSSDSSVSSISGHTNDFEEIMTDDEANTPSVYSKRSGTSGRNSLSSKSSASKKLPQQKGNALKPVKVTGSLSSGASNEATDKEWEGMECEVLMIEPAAHNRLMVFYQIKNDQKAGKPDTPGLLSKRPATDVSPGPPAKKKASKNSLGETDSQGNWAPLDEYYYGTMEGDPAYEENKGEFRFKCWYCSKMLYNNVRAMQHIQGHIDSTKQQNIDLSDLTQCKHCYKQFDTPFEMQTHVEKVHLSNKVLMCRICEKDFHGQGWLIQHMRQNHSASEMPYICQLCNFRSSMYSDVVDHFKKKHDSSKHLLCLYCLRTFDVKFVNQGWGQTQTYYGHLMKHQSKSSAKKCTLCRLTFFNPLDVKLHKKNNHGSNTRGVPGLLGDKLSGANPVMIKVPDSGAPQKKSQGLKSLNAPSISKIQNYGSVLLPKATKTSKCVECKTIMSSTDHYKKHIHCSLCRFATSCSVAYANHMMGFHSGQMSSLNLNIPWERPLADMLYCKCGFSTKYGNKIANHLVFCLKQTCYSRKPQAVAGGNKLSQAKKGETKKSDGSLLGMLGLVQKKNVPSKVKTSQSAMKSKKEEKAEELKTIEAKKAKKRSVSPKPGLKANQAEKPLEKEDTKATANKDNVNKEKLEESQEQKANSKMLVPVVKRIEEEKVAEVKKDSDITETVDKKESEPAKVEDNTKSESNKTAADQVNEKSQADKSETKTEEAANKVLESQDAENKTDLKEDSAEEDETKQSDEHSMDDENTQSASGEKKEESQDEDDMEDDIIETKDSKNETESDLSKDENEMEQSNNSISGTKDDSQGSKETENNPNIVETETTAEDENELEETTEKEEKMDTEADNVDCSEDNTVKEVESDKVDSAETQFKEPVEPEVAEPATSTQEKEEDEMKEKDEDTELEGKDEGMHEKPESEKEEKAEDERKEKQPEKTDHDDHSDRRDSEHRDHDDHRDRRDSGNRDHHDDHSDRRDSGHRDHDDHRDSRDSGHRDHDDHSDRRDSGHRSDDRHSNSSRDSDRHRSDDRSRDNRHRSDRSYDSSRSDGNRQHDRGYERDRSHDRSHRDDRGDGYHRQRGHGYHGNQDRNRDYNRDNYNRNYGNRDGYNQNYRGGGYGGGYY